jgi:hypothetical protein
MSAAELNALEREVELTRAKFANDLARLRSPHNIAEFKEDYGQLPARPKTVSSRR